jgi:uncharacterized membrane protein YphA (DoxX/SURF4 family)
MKSEPPISKGLNIFLWIIQVLVAGLFIWTGANKLFNSQDLPWSWIKQYPNLVKITAILDITGGFGLILPQLFRIRPQLTVLAACGVIALMISAIVFHISRGESSQIGFNIVVLLMVVFVAGGRYSEAAIVSKQ